MTNRSLKTLVYHSPLVVAGIFAVGVQAADTTEQEEIFKTTLNECVNKKSDELSGWDRIVNSFYYDAESARRCQTEVRATLQMMEDQNYIEKQATDSEYRDRVTRVHKFTAQDSGKLNPEGLGSGFNVVRFDPDKKRESEGRAKVSIKTVPGYTTQSGIEE